MASAAFKSTSRRGNETSNSSNKEPPKRRVQRSLSVSAVPRNQLDIDSDFLNKRENPLFWSNTSPDKEIQQPEKSSGSQVNGAAASKSAASADQRGRSVTRNADFRGKKTSGRSLSRGQYGYGASESEVEQESARSRNYRSISDSKSALSNVKRHNSVRSGDSETEVEQESVKPSNYRNLRKPNIASSGSQKSNSVRNPVGTLARTRSLKSVSNLHSIIVSSDDSTTSLQIPNWEDEISTASLSEVEKKTIKAVCEQMTENRLGDVTSSSGIYETVRSEVRRAISDIRNDLESAIRRNNAIGTATTDVTSIPPDLVKPGAVELVLDIRREYATKLEESQERARKLRSDLAVEEHRGQELSRILKETLPDPKISAVQRSHPERRTSSERKKMSKRLTEEAMSYFDECVSISTFDSSDFSAAEDQPHSFGATIPVNFSASLAQKSPCITAINGQSNRLNYRKEVTGHGQLMHSCEDSGLTANSSSCDPPIDKRDTSADWGRKSQFSFAREPAETTRLQQEIRSYLKKFEKGVDAEDINAEITSYSSFNVDEYDLQGRKESLLFDTVSFKNRIESGSLHLCAGGLAISFLPFPSVI